MDPIHSDSFLFALPYTVCHFLEEYRYLRFRSSHLKMLQQWYLYMKGSEEADPEAIMMGNGNLSFHYWVTSLIGELIGVQWFEHVKSSSISVVLEQSLLSRCRARIERSADIDGHSNLVQKQIEGDCAFWIGLMKWLFALFADSWI